MIDEMFFDTNILGYAYDATEPVKREVCKKLVEKVFRGEMYGVISNQVLVELYNACTRKFGVPIEEARMIVKTFAASENWRKIDYTHGTVEKALADSEMFRAPFLDALMAETMREFGIKEMITEDDGDFGKIPWVMVKNPFKE
jgi:predicted nucleic acid-binding protein